MRRNKEGDIRRIPSPNDNELSAARSETHGLGWDCGDFQPGQWTGSGLAD
jgi:hypothetical protein